ncbi:hypothetical protein MMN21_03090 [Helicobacter pylori]
MDILRVKYSLTLALKTLFLGSLAGGFNLVLCVGVRDFALFVLVSACTISLSSLELFSVSFVFLMFLSSFFRIQTPFFKRSFGLKLR